MWDVATDMEDADDLERFRLGTVDDVVAVNAPEPDILRHEILSQMAQARHARQAIHRFEEIVADSICGVNVVGRDVVPDVKQIVTGGRGKPEGVHLRLRRRASLRC